MADLKITKFTVSLQENGTPKGDFETVNLVNATVTDAGGGQANVTTAAGGGTGETKADVRAASTANGALATAFENGDTLDGVTLATGDRILLKDQSTGAENGIYTVNASGAPTRASDMLAASAAAGARMFVQEGTANAERAFRCTNNAGSDSVETDALVFAAYTGAGQMDSITASGGIVVNATDPANPDIAIGAGNGLVVNALDVDVDESLLSISLMGDHDPEQHDVKIRSGSLAARGAASASNGVYYQVTDSAPYTWAYSNGTDWLESGNPVDDASLEISGGAVQIAGFDGASTDEVPSKTAGGAIAWVPNTGGGGVPAGIGAYTFSSTTGAASDPGTGGFRFDAAVATAVEMYIDDINLGGINSDRSFREWKTGDFLRITKTDDQTVGHLLEITGPPADNTGYWTIPIDERDAGSGAAIADTNQFVITHEPTSKSDVILAQRATAGTINAGRLVRIVGVNFGNRWPTVEEASASAATTLPAVGFTLDQITDSQEGRVRVLGQMTGLATTGFSEGDPVYVGDTAGTFSTTPGTIEQRIGICNRVNASTGQVYLTAQQRVPDAAAGGDPSAWHTSNTFAWRTATGSYANIANLTFTVPAGGGDFLFQFEGDCYVDTAGGGQMDFRLWNNTTSTSLKVRSVTTSAIGEVEHVGLAHLVSSATVSDGFNIQWQTTVATAKHANGFTLTVTKVDAQ